MDIKKLHSKLMKMHSNLFNDYVFISYITYDNKKTTKKIPVTSEGLEQTQSEYTSTSLNIKILKEDLVTLNMPLSGYEDATVKYNGEKYQVIKEKKANGSFQDLLILHIDRVGV